MLKRCSGTYTAAVYTSGRFSVKRENGGHYFHSDVGARILKDETGDVSPVLFCDS